LLVQVAAAGCKITRRTIERDLQSLSAVFPLVVDERSKPFGWSWDRDAPAFGAPELSTSEALTLLMAREHLAAVLPSTAMRQLDGTFRQAEGRLRGPTEGMASWRGKVRIVLPTQPLQAPAVDEGVLAAVQEALLRGRQCLVTYQKRGRESAETYDVNPLGLLQRGQVLYLAATIKSYSDVRLLALHRMQAAAMQESRPASSPPGFSLDDYLASGILGWNQGGEIRLEVLFEPEAGTHLLESPLSADQASHTEPDGRLRVTATVRQTQQLLWWLLGFGAAVEVLAPASLRNAIGEQLKLAAGRYAVEKPVVS
jgi:predicted DNA-binding transcriptional regulator YafY